jgi:hypothetical protein
VIVPDAEAKERLGLGGSRELSNGSAPSASRSRAAIGRNAGQFDR